MGITRLRNHQRPRPIPQLHLPTHIRRRPHQRTRTQSRRKRHSRFRHRRSRIQWPMVQPAHRMAHHPHHPTHHSTTAAISTTAASASTHPTTASATAATGRPAILTRPMIYNLANDLEERNFALRVERLTRQKAMVELTEKRPRSLRQNAYCHLAIAYFALQIGLPPAEVKDAYFKTHCSPDIFIRTRFDPILHTQRTYMRSTAQVTAQEMTTAIDRFLQFAAEQGIYIAPPDQHIALLHMQHDVEQAKRYL